jgi:hypothetical protein
MAKSDKTKPEDDIEDIALPEDQPEPVTVDLAAEEPAGGSGDAAPAEPSPEDDMQAQLDAAKREKAEADRRAEAAEQRAAEERRRYEAESRQSKAELSDTRLATISNAMEANAAQIRDLKAQRRAALEGGNFEAEESLTDQLMELSTKRQRLQEGKTALEQQIEHERNAPKQPSPDDALANWKNQLSPASRQWVDSHPDVIRDAGKFRKLGAAHQAAVDLEGLDADTPEYFDYINERMGFAEPETPPPQRRAAPASAPAAPPSRSAPSASTGRTPGSTYTLSPREREAADIAGISYPEYARNKLALEKSGEITKH